MNMNQYWHQKVVVALSFVGLVMVLTFSVVDSIVVFYPYLFLLSLFYGSLKRAEGMVGCGECLLPRLLGRAFVVCTCRSVTLLF